MRFSRQAALAALVFALATPFAANAQQTATPTIAVGKWTGQVTPPNGETTDVTYDVSMKNDTLHITINAAQYGVFDASQIKLEPGKLTFVFTPGPQVLCTLTRKEDSSYAGTCSDENGAPAQMTMVPPKKENSGS